MTDAFTVTAAPPIAIELEYYASTADILVSAPKLFR